MDTHDCTSRPLSYVQPGQQTKIMNNFWNKLTSDETIHSMELYVIDQKELRVRTVAIVRNYFSTETRWIDAHTGRNFVFQDGFTYDNRDEAYKYLQAYCTQQLQHAQSIISACQTALDHIATLKII